MSTHHRMRELNLAQMAGTLAQGGVTFYSKAQAGLELWAKAVERKAEAKFGNYQRSQGPFPGWPQLADDTKKERVRLGFSENDPLLRTGGMKASISHEVWGLEAVVGSTDEKMVWHELGSADGSLPARPVLGPSAFETKRLAEEILGRVALSGVLNTDLGRVDGTLLTAPGYSHGPKP